MKKPYVSVVIVGRHDDYGDNFLTRINTFVRSLDHQVRNYADLFELVVVEWNPLADKLPLAQVLHPTKNLKIRVITVPANLHNTLNAAAPVLEFHGKNVGIRRAHGEFVLVTNPDILFTQQLIDEIAKQKLRINTVYRTDRCDFYTDGIENVSSNDLVDFAVKNTFVVHGMRGAASTSMPVSENDRLLDKLPQSVIDPDALHTNGCGDFMIAAKEVFFTIRGLYETLEHRWHVDSISLFRFKVAQLKQQVLTRPCCVFHQHHARKPEDIGFGQLNIQELASKPGHTKWGFAGELLTETIKEPQ